MYKYYVFISYKRKGDSETWMNDIFYPIVTNFFIDRLGLNIAFKDSEEQAENYGTGVDNFLENGLVYSRCMIAILNPPYFCRSYWCIREFSTMKFRAEQSKSRLLFPVIFTKDQDVSLLRDSCPSLSLNIENSFMPLLLDEKKFYLTNKAFQDSSDFNLLKQKIRDWLDKSVLPAIVAAPEWQAGWNTEEWLKEPYEDFKKIIDCKPIYRQVTL